MAWTPSELDRRRPPTATHDDPHGDLPDDLAIALEALDRLAPHRD